MLQETLIRKTRLLRKIGPMAMRSSVASKIVLSRAVLRWLATNDLEIAFPKREQHLVDAFAIQNSDRSPLHDVRNHACDFIEKSCMQNCVCFADVVVVAIGLQPVSLPSATHRRFPCVAVSLRGCATRSPKRGGARRDRTDDLLLAKQALSQLSYGP